MAGKRERCACRRWGPPSTGSLEARHHGAAEGHTGPASRRLTGGGGSKYLFSRMGKSTRNSARGSNRLNLNKSRIRRSAHFHSQLCPHQLLEPTAVSQNYENQRQLLLITPYYYHSPYPRRLEPQSFPPPHLSTPFLLHESNQHQRQH